MKAILKRINGDQQGVALVLALVVLLLGGLITAGLLAHMGAGLLATETYDRRTAELYAADAGVEDAIWKIQNHVEQVKELTQCRQSWSYNITDIDGRVAEVNDKHVEVTITLISVWEDIPCDYRIVSRAISDCSETQIEAYISGASVSDDYSGILDGILTSQGGLDWKDKVTLIYPEGHEPADNYEGAWPDEPAEVDRFVRFYRMDLEDEPGFDSDTVDLAGTDMNLQQVYRDGELAIKNSIKTDPAPTLCCE
jgi:Tfp pilus assembly protein PilX